MQNWVWVVYPPQARPKHGKDSSQAQPPPSALPLSRAFFFSSSWLLFQLLFLLPTIVLPFSTFLPNFPLWGLPPLTLSSLKLAPIHRCPMTLAQGPPDVRTVPSFPSPGSHGIRGS